jgi:hypothetical protein
VGLFEAKMDEVPKNDLSSPQVRKFCAEAFPLKSNPSKEGDGRMMVMRREFADYEKGS